METLHSVACESLKARPSGGFVALANYETLSVSFDENDSLVVHRDTTIPPDQIIERSQNGALFGDTSCRGRAALQLLLCKSIGGAKVREQERLDHPIPFADYATYELIRHQLQLPNVYMHHFKERHAVPLHVIQHDMVSGEPKTFYYRYGNAAYIRSGIMCQTPAYGDLFMSISLSYDPGTGITKGLVVATIHSDTDTIFERCLQGLLPFAAHPLMCITVMYHTLDKDCASILRNIDDKMEAITASIGHLPPELMKKPQAQKEYLDIHKIHEQLIAQHKRLTRSTFDVMARIGEACAVELDSSKIRSSTIHQNISEPFHAAHDALQQYVDTISFGTRYRTQERKRLLQRIDVQLQELYNMITTEIAKSAAADNKLMIHMTDETVKISRSSHAIAESGESYAKNIGAISLITMIFLPATAFASVFSMSPFFTVSDETSRLVVSRQIWIYFAWMGPVTVFVLSLWAAYACRDWIRILMQRRLRPSDEEGNVLQKHNS